MRTQKLFLSILLVLFASISFAANISSTGSGGNWSDGSTWEGGTVPAATDDVTIVAGATVTATAAITINNIVIENGATFAAGTYTHTITGNWTENGTGQMTGSSTIQMSATLIQSIINPATFYNLTFNGGGIGVIGANITVTNDLLITNNTEVKTSQSNVFQANFTVADGSIFEATAGTSNFNSSSAQTITIGTTSGTSNVQFWNAYFDNGGAANPKTIDGDMIARGIMYIYDDAELGDINNDKVHTIYGGMRIDGTCAFTGKIIAMGGTIYDDNDHAITLNAELVSKYLYIGSATSNLALTTNENVTVGIEDDGVYNYLVISKGSTLTGIAGKTLLVKNSKRLYIRGASNFPTGFGTITLEEASFVVYDDNADQTINNNVTYGHLYLNNTPGSSTTKGAGGGLTVMGNIYIYNSSKLDLVNFDHHFKGHIVNNNDANGNGSITSSGGTVYLDAPDANQYIYDAGTGSYTFNNLTISNSAPTSVRYKRFYNDIIINGNFTVTNTGGSNANRLYVDMYEHFITGSGGSSDFNLGENVWLLNNGENNFETSINSFSGTKNFHANSTVRFNRTTNASHQNIPNGLTYGNIELYGSNEKLPQGNLDVNGYFAAVGYTPILKDNANMISVAGDWKMSLNTTDLTASSIINFDGNNQNISSSHFSYVYFTNGGTKTLLGTLDIENNLVMQDAVIVDGVDRTIYIAGNWDEQSGQFVQTGGYVVFDGITANQTVNAQANSYFYNFRIDKPGSYNLVTFNSKVDVNGTFDFVENNAALDLNGKDLHIARNFYFRGGCSFTHNNGKVFFDGSEGTYQLIRNYHTDTIVFNDVEFSGTLVKRLYDNSFRFQGDVFINNTTLDGQWWEHYVEGNWTNTGIFRHSSILHFDGSSNQTISQSSFHSVRFGDGDGDSNSVTTKTLSGDINLTGNLWIDDATLDVGAGNNSITLDDYWHNDSTGGFNPRQGTVTVTGEYNRIYTGKTNTLHGAGQVVTQAGAGAKDFYNLIINATNDDYWMFIHGNLTVLNDFIIEKGRFYQSYDPYQYGINDIEVGGDFIHKGELYENNYGEKLTLNPTSGSHIFDPGSSNTYSITNFEGAAGTSYTFKSNLNLYANRAITITSGDLDLNSNKITTNAASGNITMNGGSLEVDSAAIISMGAGSTFTNGGGTFKLVGHPDDPASLIATSGNFTFLQNSGTIHAQNYRITGTSGNGIDIQGGSIDATNTFQNGSFSAGIGNSYLTTSGIDLGGDRTITGVTFNTGPSYNVERTSGNGAMNFENATGTLAGEDYDNDPVTFVNWTYPGAAFWDGDTDGDGNNTTWNDPLNWSNDVVPDANTIVILDHSAVAGAYTVDLSTTADGLAKSISINSNGTQIELKLNGQKLTVSEDITIGTSSVLTQTNAADEITLGGSWSNAGTFNEGTSTVVFNPVTGTHTITTQGAADPFYNLTINGTGGTNVISSTVDINGNVNIQSGILNAGTNTINVAGNWTRGGGSIFDIGTSTVNFDGTNQNINGGEFYNLTTSSSGTKTTTANVDIDNNLTIGAGTTFDGGTNIVYVGHDLNNNVGIAGFSQSGAGTIIFDATHYDQHISNTNETTFNNVIITGTRTKYTVNNIIINGNLIVNNASLWISDEKIITGTAGGTLNQSGGRIYVAGDFDGTNHSTNNFPAGFGTINLSGGDVDYYSNENQTIYPTTYNILRVRRINAGNQQTKTLVGDITVNSYLSIYDDETLLDVNNFTINLGGNLNLVTGGRQINWEANGTLIHFGSSWTVDKDIDFLNNVIKKNQGYMRVVYKSLDITGNLSILEDAYLRQDTVNITCTAANKTFTLAATAFVYSYNPETLGASSGRKAFPVNFANYNLHKDSRVYLAGTVGDQEIYSVPNYGNLFLWTHAEINMTLDGNLDIEGDFRMLNEPTLVDAGHNINIAGSLIDIKKYTPTGSTIMTFDGADQRIYDAGAGATIFDMKNVVFAGSGQKTLYYGGDDWYNVTGDLTINNGVTVYLPRRLDFSGDNWLNNGTFNHTAYTVNFTGTSAQSIDPGADNNFYSVSFINSGTKTFTTNGINVNNGSFTVGNSTTVNMGSGLTHFIASERITNNGGTWTTENANFIFDRNGTQYLPALVCQNLTFRRYDQWDRVRYLEGAININDLNIEDGTQLRCSQNSETSTTAYNVTMNGNFTNNGRLYAWGNTFDFESDDTSAKTIKQGTGSFDNVKFNQSLLGQSARTYTLTEETRFYEDLTIGKNATLKLNGQMLRLGNDDPNDPIEPNAEEHLIDTNGTLDVDAGASLIFSCRDQGNPKLDVSGTLKIIGTNGNNATITSTDWNSNLHRIDININSGATISAQYYLMKYLVDDGFYVDAGATIDASNNFSNGTWSDISTSGSGTHYYLKCNADVSGIGTVNNVVFNFNGTPSVGNHFNVKRAAGSTGVLTFDGTSSGLLAGSTYEADDTAENTTATSLIEWPIPSEVYWTGNVSTDWFNSNNWSPTNIPTNLTDAIIPIRNNNPNIDGNGAQCKDLKILDGFLTLKNGNNLTVSGDVYVGLGTDVGILAVNNSSSAITVNGNWTRAQNALFVHGDGTVIFNAGGGSISIDPRDSEFGNITFNGGASFFLNRNTIYVDDNFTISSGTVQPIVNDYNLHIKGNYNNSGGNYDNTTHGTVYFDGTNNQTITNADLWAVTVDGSGNKTTANTCIINGNLIVKNGVLVGGNTIDMNNYVTIEATGGFDDGGFTHTFSGYRWIGTGSYIGTGVIEFDRDGYQHVKPSKFNSLLLKNNGGVILEGNVDMTGDLSLIAPNTYLNVVDYQVNNTSGSGTFSMADTRRIYVRGANNFPTGFNSYDFHRNSYTYYDGTMPQTIAPVPIVYGRVYLDNSAKTMGGHLDINGILYFYDDASLDVTANNYRINLQGDWYNVAGASFIPQQGEVIFDGNDQNTYLRVYDISKNTNPFYDLTVNKGVGRVLSYWTDITVQNNLRVINGNLYQSQTMFVGGDMSALSGTFSAVGTYYLNKSSGSSNLQMNNSTLNNLTINSGAVYTLQDELKMNGNYNLIAGTFDGNGQLVRMGNYGEANEISGLYKIGAGGTLQLPNYGTFKVNSGGEVDVVGAPNNIATVTNYTGRYYFNIESGATIKARNYLFEYMAENGIYIKSGGIIDNNYNFSYGTFTNAANGGTCLRIENIQDFTEAGGNPILEVTFPKNPNGGASNVTKTSENTGTLDFKDYSGEFAGEAFDNDPSNIINWVSPPFVMWTGNVDNDWYKIGNWEVSAGADRIPLISDNVVITKRTNQPIINHDDAVAKTLDVQQDAILTLNTTAATDTTLLVAEDVNFDGMIVMTSANDTLTTGGNWTNSGMFIPGQGTVILNSPFGIKTINNRTDNFNNLYVNTQSDVQLSSNTTVNGDFIINQGNFDLGSNARIFTVKGNFLNYGNIITQNGKVVLAGNLASQIFNPGTSTYYNIDVNANSGTSVNLTSNELSIKHNMNLNTGTFNLNSNVFNMGDGVGTDVLTINGGTFSINNNAFLKPANNSSIEVNGGVFKLVGSDADYPAYLQSQSGTYGFNVNSGTIQANFYSVQNTNVNGIRIKSGATIDATNNFSNGIWQNGASTGQYLWLENDFADFTVNNVYFYNGASVNVKRLSGNGIITFEDALGLLAGSNFEDDNPAHGDADGNILWTYTHDQYTWTGDTNIDWNVATNWDVPTSVDASGHAVPNQFGIALIPDVSGVSGNFPTLGVNAADANGTCYDLKIEADATLTINNAKNLDVDNAVTIFTNGTLTVSAGSVSNINVADTWAVDGTFNHGFSSTVILDAPSGKIVTISGNNSFYNLQIVSSGTAEYTTGDPVYMDGFFDVNSGEFTVTNSTDTLYVGGNLSNTGTFNHGNSVIVLNGGNQNILNTGTGNFYKLICDGSQNKILNSNIVLENDIIIENGVAFNGGSYNFTLYGDWINRGTFNPATGTVSFEGASTQIIQNYNQETFYNLTINNTASTFPQIILYGNVDVTGNNWTMTDGVIETSSTEMLQIYSGVNLTGGNTDASYVSGPITKIGDQNFTFPIGKGTKFARLGISGLINSGTFVAEYFEAPYSDLTNVDASIDHVSGYEHWTLDRNAGAGEPTVTFFWEDGAQSGIDNLATLTTALYTGGQWGNMNNGGTSGNITAGSISSGSPFTNFGPCGFAATNNTDNPLHGYTRWTGNSSIVWNNLDNWTAGVPTSSKDALIPAAPANQPTIDVNAITRKLTIDESASVIINPLKSLTVEDKFLLNGKLLLKSDNTGNASLINKTPITYGANSDVKEQLYLSGFKFHHLSSPMVSTNPDIIKSDPVAPYYNHNFLWYDEHDLNVDWTAGWHEYSGAIMGVGEGYTVYFDRNPTIIYDRSTCGNFNSSDINKNLTYTGNSAAPLIHRGWNFVGNPFPAYLDWDDASWTKTNIYNSVYFWNGTSYSYYVGTSGEDPSDPDGIEVNGASKNIPPMQGFFVKVKEGGVDTQNQTGSITIPLNARTTDTHAYWKNSNLKTEIDVIRINVSGNDKTDETAIRFIEGATSQIDAEYDAFKIFSGSWYGMPQIYSVISEDVNAAINTLPGYYNELIIPIGFQTSASGLFTIDIPQFDLDKSTEIFFEDVYENKIYEISNGLNYNFSSDEGEFNDRFRILFSVTTDVEDVNNEITDVDIYSYGTDIYLKSTRNEALIGDVQIVNMTGSLVYHSNNTKEGFARIDFRKYPAGTYIVKLTNEYGVFIEKVFIMEN